MTLSYTRGLTPECGNALPSTQALDRPTNSLNPLPQVGFLLMPSTRRLDLELTPALILLSAATACRAFLCSSFKILFNRVFSDGCAFHSLLELGVALSNR